MKEQGTGWESKGEQSVIGAEESGDSGMREQEQKGKEEGLNILKNLGKMKCFFFKNKRTAMIGKNDIYIYSYCC